MTVAIVIVIMTRITEIIKIKMMMIALVVIKTIEIIIKHDNCSIHDNDKNNKGDDGD